MGLDYSYLLYFKREHLWNALQGVVDISERHDHPPAIIHFPDRNLILPIQKGFQLEREKNHDDPEFNFITSLIFEEDETIREYMLRFGDEGVHRAPPDLNGITRVAIGYIYLTVYADLAKYFDTAGRTDWVLFKFRTTGTRMSLLFDESASIRSGFIELLERCQGVCGVFDREIDCGELFWLGGKRLSLHLSHDFLLPDKLEQMLLRHE